MAIGRKISEFKVKSIIKALKDDEYKPCAHIGKELGVSSEIVRELARMNNLVRLKGPTIDEIRAKNKTKDFLSFHRRWNQWSLKR